MHRAAIPALMVIIIMATAQSCGWMKKPSEPVAGEGASFSFNERVGWVDGPCLAISNANLAPGTLVAVVITGEPQSVLPTRINKRTDSPETCHALMPDRASVNAKEGMAFYALEGEGGGPTGLTDVGVGIVAPPGKIEVVNGTARADLDQDGEQEVFTACATSEGISFGIWTGKAYGQKSRWSGYYYLAYDTEPTCPIRG